MNNLQITFLTVFVCILTFELNAQSKLDSTNVRFESKVEHRLYLSSDFNIKGAEKNIKEKNIRILFPGGFGGMPDFNNEEDISFQKKYSVEYFSQGCIRIGDDENEKEYNETIFKHLDKKFGESWRNEIRTGAIGFK